MRRSIKDSVEIPKYLIRKDGEYHFIMQSEIVAFRMCGNQIFIYKTGEEKWSLNNKNCSDILNVVQDALFTKFQNWYINPVHMLRITTEMGDHFLHLSNQLILRISEDDVKYTLKNMKKV